jgi:DNA-directed RNA polymerase subunit RPC12/RpoP
MGLPGHQSAEDCKHAMAMWRERQARAPKFMQCAYCGSGAYEGERCEGCGSRQFLRPVPNVTSQASSLVPLVKRGGDK